MLWNKYKQVNSQSLERLPITSLTYRHNVGDRMDALPHAMLSKFEYPTVEVGLRVIKEALG
jgi:hypothetical protein